MRTSRSTLLALVLLAPLPASAQEHVHPPHDEETDPPSMAALLTKMKQNGERDLQTAEMALRRGASAQVKRFAQTLIDDHRRGLQRIEASARRQDLSLEAEVEEEPVDRALQRAAPAMSEVLATLHGPAFDRGFLAWTVFHHDWQLGELIAVRALMGQLPTTAVVTEHIDMLQQHRAQAAKLLTAAAPAARQARSAPRGATRTAPRAP